MIAAAYLYNILYNMDIAADCDHAIFIMGSGVRNNNIIDSSTHTLYYNYDYIVNTAIYSSYSIACFS
jgi:hypothetical protein